MISSDTKDLSNLTTFVIRVPLDGKSWMFGDNESVVKSSTISQSNLMKRHNALAYHLVQEAIAAVIIEFLHIPPWYSKPCQRFH